MNENITQITSILLIGVLAGAGILAIIAFSPLDQGAYTYKLNTFQSYDDLLKFLQKRYETDVSQGRYYSSLNANIEKSDSSTTGALGLFASSDATEVFENHHIKEKGMSDRTHVLIVEDSEESATFLSRILEEHGYPH